MSFPGFASSASTGNLVDEARQQAKLLEEAMAVVKAQSYFMKRCFEGHALMDGLKHCSTMLSELRTSLLAPKHYYELYMAVFDSLQHLSHYLHETHLPGQSAMYSPRQLADLYELVQYAGNIIPRLYLMITVGAVYMATKETPVKVVLRDMMEMSRGVQHPLRGLFLRHYLSSVTKDYLPDSDRTAVMESIQFVIMNFTEMNKLWVRMQYSGGFRDSQKRDADRLDLRILVGTPLVRLSQLESVDMEIYKDVILPRIAEQVVNCRDRIAQEYLMEVVVQVFGDGHHLQTIEELLQCVIRLRPDVKVIVIVKNLAERLQKFVMEGGGATKKIRAKSRQATVEEGHESSGGQSQQDPSNQPNGDTETTANHNVQAEVRDEVDEATQKLQNTSISAKSPEDQEGSEKTSEDATGRSESNQVDHVDEREYEEETIAQRATKLFAKFWRNAKLICEARVDMPLSDVADLLLSLMDMSLITDPDGWEQLDNIWSFCQTRVDATPDSIKAVPGSLHKLEELLIKPLQNRNHVNILLGNDWDAIKGYRGLLSSLPHSQRRSVSVKIIECIIVNDIGLNVPEQVMSIVDLCSVLIRDAPDQPISVVRPEDGQSEFESSGKWGDDEDFALEQGMVAKLTHHIRSEDTDTHFYLLSSARKVLAEGGGRRMKYTFPALVHQCTRIAHRYKPELEEPETRRKVMALYGFIQQLIATLYSHSQTYAMCLKLYLMAAQSSNNLGIEDVTYEFFVQAFTVYEDSISESKAQFMAISLLVGTLQTCRVFDDENYDTITKKCALHASKLLKRGDQCRAVTLCSHLFWQTSYGSERAAIAAATSQQSQSKPQNGDEAIQQDSNESLNSRCPIKLQRDPKRVLECLQKALRIADSCVGQGLICQLFLEILDRYIYFFELQNPSITPKYLNGLINIIITNLQKLNPDDVPQSTIEQVHRHLRSTLEVIEARKRRGPQPVDYTPVDTSWMFTS